MFTSPINSTKVSFGHIYSNAVDTVIRNSDRLTKRQESNLNNVVSRASQLKKSVITSSTSNGYVLLTTSPAGSREIYQIYPVGRDAKTNIQQLESAVQDAERLEKKDFADINPLKKGETFESSKGKSESGCYQNIYDKTINGYNSSF